MNTSRGGRNLLILGGAALIIATITTSVSLYIYRQSGDIYLDRSRPGYLPDPEEAQADSTSTAFEFSETGPIDATELDRYLEEYHALEDQIKKVPDPYSAEALSDAALGISANTSDSAQ